ncbi:MAG TPA: gliding motility protein GldL [Chitinophagales bacterium]|nr:gliding motility protein GldL [Chitinophagales bacterium]HNM31531.1 gliding motility protein GldL [Chitinophagales bacterium]
MASYFKTKSGKRAKNLLFGVGAAVVIIGAWAKILHIADPKIAGIPFYSYMLTLGLLTEAVIFFISGFIPPEPDYYWEKVYPGLDIYDENSEKNSEKYGHTAIGSTASSSLSGEMDKMLQAAKIDQSLVTKFGDSLKGFSDQVGKLSNMADATVASNEFAGAAKAAASSLNGVKESFASAADGMGKLAAASGDASQYHAQVQSATKNLAALNAVYEMELQDTNTHLKTMNKFINNLSTAMTNLDGSLADTEKFKSQMGGLAGNLEKLNGIYGNMLSAMRS